GLVTDPNTVGTDAQAFVFTLDATGTAGPVGAAGSIKVISITQGQEAWLGVDATGISLSLDASPVSVSLTHRALEINRARGGASKIDWISFSPSGLPLPHLDVAGAIDLHVGGALALVIDLTGIGSGSFSARGIGSLDRGLVSDAATTPQFTGAEALALTL